MKTSPIPAPEIVGKCQQCHVLIRGNKTTRSYHECGSRTKDGKA